MVQGFSGELTFLDLATLQTLQGQYVACLTAIAQGNQSYSIAGRSFTRADLVEVRKTLGEISYAIQFKTGTIQRQTYADMSHG